MKKFFQKIRLIYKTIYKGFLFIATIAFLMYMFPREGKFQYEFQKGKPWLHKALIAPFDFPIYKSEAKLQAERDSILKMYRPYFNLDTGMYNLQSRNFSLKFNEYWNEFLQTRISRKDSANKNFRIDILRQHRSRDIKYVNELLKFAYVKGIVDIPDIVEKTRENGGNIMVVHNNLAVQSSSREVFTLKEAYAYIMANIEKMPKDEAFPMSTAEYNFLTNLEIDAFLQPNLYFDENFSNSARQDLINQISLTEGLVQAGERIISQGELVSSLNFPIIESLKIEYERKLGGSTNFYLIIIGQFILVFLVVLVLFLFLMNFRKEILEDSLKTTFILLLVVLTAFLASLTLKYSIINQYVVPFAILPIIIKTFYDSRLALFIHMVTLLIISFWAPNSFEFYFINIIAGIIAIFSLTNLYRRGKLFASAIFIVLSMVIVYFGISIIKEGNMQSIDYEQMLWFGGNGLLILTSYPLIYIFEKIFGFVSDATLMELSDTNQPLLRMLSEKAPGTFQHSLQVANLAEEAIFHIGGNPLLIRTGALYHDIGKMENPIYFVENQSSNINPHKDLEFEESANIIINHVIKGVEIARKYNLPENIIDFIRTHHGTSAVQYFYRSYLKKYPEKSSDIKKFSYPGPKPFSKEMAVLMMADSVEAASRSLKEPTRENITDLVESIINYQIIEDQYVNADVTFRDITTIKALFIRKLQNIYHVRIAYPKAIN